MKFSSLTKTAQKLLVLTGIIGMGALSASPALADNQGEMTQSPRDMSQMSTDEDMESPSDSNMPTDGASTETGNIVEVLSTNPSFSNLVEALEAAGLVDTLADSSSSYTLFAPTDEAFSKLPEGALDYLLKPENKETLQRVLSYHVLPEAVTSDEISGGEIDSLDGGLATEVTDEGIVVNNASVATPDVQASNGVIHSIDRVLLPRDVQSNLASELGIDESQLYQ